MKIKGFLTDVGGAGRVTKVRKEAFESASGKLDFSDKINAVARELHPQEMTFEVIKVSEVSLTAKKYTFKAVDGTLPPFQCGQYVSLRLKIGNTVTTRPYSICSAPYQAREEDAFFEIVVRDGAADGFAANYIYDNIKVGDKIRGSLPYGQFYYEELRDGKNIVALAGGSGITPFYSMAQEIEHGSLDVNLTILYGSVSPKDIILKKELEAINSPKVKIVHVISGDENYKGEKGFLCAEIIKKYSSDASYFVCGPRPMYDYVRGELEKSGVLPRRIRTEIFGAPKNIAEAAGYPKGKEDEKFEIAVMRGIDKTVIGASGREPVAVALERSGILIGTRCRSGSCGFCRSKLIKGEIFVPAEGDGRRAADKEFNYFHPCASYPLSDLTIKIPIE